MTQGKIKSKKYLVDWNLGNTRDCPVFLRSKYRGPKSVTYIKLIDERWYSKPHSIITSNSQCPSKSNKLTAVNFGRGVL